MPTKTMIPEFGFGDRLAKAREVAGLTQDDMAEKLGLSHSTVNKWEHGTQPRKMLEVVTKWAEITGVSRTWLLEGPEGFNTRGSSTLRNSNGRRPTGPGNTRPYNPEHPGLPRTG